MEPLARRGSFTLPAGADTGPGAHPLPPGWPHSWAYRHPAYPQVQTNPQMLMQDRVPVYWNPPPRPPPPYSGPAPALGEPVPRTSQAGPSRQRGRRRPKSPAEILRQDSNDGPEGDGTGSDAGPSSRHRSTGRSATRTNPTRGARPTKSKLYESE